MRAVNVRGLLPVPDSYLGNAVLYAVTKLPIDFLVTIRTEHLGMIVRALRESLKQLKQAEVLDDAVALANLIPDVRNLGLSFPIWVEENFVFSSRSRLPLFDLDFGSPSSGDLGRTDLYAIS